MEENAVQVITCLFSRNRELRAVDQHLQIGRLQLEGVAEGAGGQVREIRLGQALQRELRAAGRNGHGGTVRIGRQKHLGTIRQLAHDFIKQVCRHGGGARLLHHGRGRFGDFEIEVGRLHVKIGAGGAQQNVRQDRDRVATLDDPVDVVQRFQKVRPLKSNTHGHYRFQPLRTGHRRIGKKSLHRQMPDNVDGQNGRVIAENARAEFVCRGSFCCYTT